MNINRGRVLFDRRKDQATIFILELGNDDNILTVSRMLDEFPKHQLDHFAVAIALREMADTLDRQIIT